MSLERDWRNLRNNLTENSVSNIVECGEHVVANVNADASQIGDPNRLVFVRLVSPEVLVRRQLQRRQRQRGLRRQRQQRQQQHH